jgi:hypothetical protein
MAHEVYLCFSSQDAATARTACAALESSGVSCWIAPRDIRPGEDWSRATDEAIKSAKVMVLFYSAAAHDSRSVLRDVEQAVTKHIPVIPLCIDSAQPRNSFEGRLGLPDGTDAITLTRDPDWARIIAAVRQRLGQSPANQVPGIEGTGIRTPPDEEVGHPSVFISYRPEDIEAAWRVRNALVKDLFREPRVFLDEALESETDTWRRHQAMIEKCDWVLVIIGRQWLHSKGDEGRRRLDVKGDLVRSQLALGLQLGKSMMPVLVDEAQMPAAEDLPPDLRALAYCQAVLLPEGSEAGNDLKHLSKWFATSVIEVTPQSAKTVELELKKFELPTPIEFELSKQFESVEHEIKPGKSVSLSPKFVDIEQTPAPIFLSQFVPPGLEPREMTEELNRYDAELKDASESLLQIERRRLVEKATAERARRSALDKPSLIRRLKTKFWGPPRERVDCSVFCPPSCPPGKTLFVQVFVYAPLAREEVKRESIGFDEATKERGFKVLEQLIPRGTKLDFTLAMPGLQIAESCAAVTWRGAPESVAFDVTVPDDLKTGAVVGKVTVWRDGVPVGIIRFKVLIEAGERVSDSKLAGEETRRYSMAFISYASENEREVLSRVQMLPKLGIEFFQDIMGLQPGERWKRKLYVKIDECDLFLLFWSTPAKNSEWVMREVRYALARKGGRDEMPPEIIPVPIEGPPPVTPPEDLDDLHFNDPFLYFMARQRPNA